MNGDELYYDVARQQAQEQDERRRHFDTVAMTLLGFSGVVISLMSLGSGNWASWSLWPAIGALVSFGAVALSTLFVLWLREWHFQPPLADLHKNVTSGTYDNEALVVWTAKQVARAVEHNKQPLRNKALWLRLSYVCTVLEVASMAAFAFSVAD